MTLLRPLTVLACCLLAGVTAAGCVSQDGPTGDFPSYDAGPAGFLTVVGSSLLVVPPGESVTLSVAYQGENAVSAGVPVEFAVITPEVADEDRTGGDAGMPVPPGASLEPASVLTDDAGHATTVLKVGNTPGKFQVRARVAGVEPVLFDIQVGQALSPTLSVWIMYGGARDVVFYSATVLAGLTCEEALAADKTGAEVHTVKKQSEAVTFSLAPKLTYAVVGWARDVTNAEQASGCAQYTSPLTAVPEEAVGSVQVVLEDHPMRLTGSYPVELKLDVTASMARLGDVTSAAVEASLPDETIYSEYREARAYRDTVQAVLTEQGKGDVDFDEKLAQLQAALDAKNVGHLTAAAELSTFLTNVGKTPSVHGTYGVGATNVPMTFSVSKLVTLSENSAMAFDLKTISGSMAPEATISAEYRDPKANVEVTSLSLALGLGTYGRSLLSALASSDQDWFVARLAPAAGCDIVAKWLMENSTACNEACRTKVCSETLSELVHTAETAYQSLDKDHVAVTLKGDVSAHDRDGDGLIDDLGPSSLIGNWGKALGAGSEDLAEGTFVSLPRESPLSL